MGADLSYILTALEAAPSIKSYSPELMVIPVYSAERMDQLVAAAATDNVDKEMETIAETEAAVNAMVRAVEPWLDRLHCLVVGPGLGRCPLVMRAALQIIQVARSKRLALVVDADALFLLTLYPTAVAGYTKAVLTPNAIEYARLVESGVDLTGVTVVRKGRVDVIATGDSASTVLECREPGGLKRSGGIGDILAGTLGTLLAWQVIMHPHDQQEGARLRQHQDEQQAVADSRMACWTACCVVRRATRYAYVRHGRSMTGPDVLAELGSSVRSLESREGDDDSEGE
jgi:ATP-dependent NAD(P)H-hydrate dehydratase